MKGMPVKIETIAQALEGTMDGWQQFLNKETGELVNLPTEGDDAWCDEDEDLSDEIETGDLYVCLPDQYDINEYRIMERFSLSLAHEEHRIRLLNVLKGRKPYRRFKDTINDFGIADRYFDFRLEAFRELARSWCDDNGIPYETETS